MGRSPAGGWSQLPQSNSRQVPFVKLRDDRRIEEIMDHNVSLSEETGELDRSIDRSRLLTAPCLSGQAREGIILFAV